MRAGLVGLGRMGTALIPHLVRGCSSVVTGQQANLQKRRRSARELRTLDEVTENSDVILSILFDDTAVTEVYLGPHGLLASECTGGCSWK